MTIFGSLVIFFWLIFFLYWVVSARGAKKIVHRANPSARHWGFIVVAVAILLSRLPAFQVDLIPQTVWVLALGTALCGLGIAFAILARRHLGKNWSREPSIQEGHELVTSGPYRFVRHPIYTGFFIAILGSALVGGTMWLVIFIGFCLMFVWRVKAEEGLMMQLFPQRYPEYKRGTKALIPFVW